jgi:hypothetical protein
MDEKELDELNQYANPASGLRITVSCEDGRLIVKVENPAGGQTLRRERSELLTKLPDLDAKKRFIERVIKEAQ